MGERYYFTDIGDLLAPYPPGAAVVTDVEETSYTLNGSEGSSYLNFTSADAITLTVPDDTVVDFPVGTGIGIIQGGSGAILVSPADGSVTINSFNSLNQTGGPFASAVLFKTAPGTWLLSGNLTS
jgi:hypothetical protein